jgi:hypothetical protein
MPDSILEGDHPRIISTKFGWDWLSSFRREDLVIGWFFSKNVYAGVALRPRWLPQTNLAEHRTLWEIHINIFSSETTGLIPTKLWWNGPWEFPIGSYVKLSSAVAAILVGSLKCWTYLWKGTTQGSFQQSLVEIGSVVSEKILFIFHPSFFYPGL